MIPAYFISAKHGGYISTFVIIFFNIIVVCSKSATIKSKVKMGGQEAL